MPLEASTLELAIDIQEIKFLDGCLIWNNAAVCGGMIWLKLFVSVWSDPWKSRERESTMMFSVLLMCCEYRDVLLMTNAHPSQRDTESWDYAFTGSKDELCIQPSEMELSVSAKMCDPCTILSMVM